MAVYSYNGHILPEIPVVDGHPYAYLFYLKPEYVQSYYGKTSMHFIHLSSEPYVPNSNGYFRNYTVGSSVTAYHSADGEDWVFDKTYTIKTDGYFGKPAGEETVYCWCNTNLVNNDGSVYLAASEPVSTAFVLPDGTELPALPEGCFEKYPYGMISYVESTNGEAAYALSVAEGTYIFAPGSATGEGSDYVISLLPGYRHYRYVVAPTAASGWEQYAESTTQHSGHDFSREDGTIEIRWCNHDILTATAMNDDGTPEIGPDLYRKSDVNYRIYGGWLNSMGNQARRLGNVSGALKPGEMETVFKAMPPNYGGMPSEVIYFTKQLNPGSSVECPEIPILTTDSLGMYIILFNNDDIRGVHSCIYVASGTLFSSMAMSEYISLQLVNGKYILNNAPTNDRDEIVVLCMIVSL